MMENNVNRDSDSELSDVNPENLVAEVRADLIDIDSMQVSDHANRYEELHQKLNSALSSIDGM
jgi:hypothetical protein